MAPKEKDKEWKLYEKLTSWIADSEETYIYLTGNKNVFINAKTH